MEKQVFFKKISDLMAAKADDRKLVKTLEVLESQLQTDYGIEENDSLLGGSSENTTLDNSVRCKLLAYLSYSDESDRKEGTLLDLAARSGHKRFFDKMITLFGGDLSIKLIENIRTESPEIKKSLNALISSKKKKENPIERGAKGTVHMMGGSRSPSKHAAVYLSHNHLKSHAAVDSAANPSTPNNKKIKNAFMSPNGTLRTDGQTVVKTVCEMKVFKQTVGHNSQSAQSAASLGASSSSIQMVAETEKAEFPQAIPNIDNALKAGAPLPDKYSKLPLNEKHDFSFNINANILKTWRSTKRSCSQQIVMGGYSADEIAILAGFNIREGKFQWCHLAAHSMGGPDGEKPTTKSQRGLVGPQQANNLVLGTKEANAQMVIFETSAKELIKQDIVKDLEIHLHTEFYEKLEHLHVASSLTYTLHDPKTHLSVSLKFDMLSRRKVSDQEIDDTIAMVMQTFKDGCPQMSSDEVDSTSEVIPEELQDEETVKPLVYSRVNRKLNFSDPETPEELKAEETVKPLVYSRVKRKVNFSDSEISDKLKDQKKLKPLVYSRAKRK